MFSLLESKEEISKAQLELEGTLKRQFSERAVKNIGFPGGTIFDAKVCTDGQYWYWASDHKGRDIAHPRRLNWFGLFRKNVGLEISVEINTPYKGRDDSVAGFFARDNETGTVYLLHSGRVGGGTKGVSKTAFLAWSGLRPIEVADSSGTIRDGILVMPITGKGATRSAARYIGKIAEFKLAVRAGALASPQFQRKQKAFSNYYAESTGRRRGKRSGDIDYLSRHGEVVDELHAWRKQNPLPKGGRVVKSELIDLGIAVNRDLVEVFEVKTSTTRPDLYAAIGQLMVHGSSDVCRRILVLPDKEQIAFDVEDALRRLGIELLKFQLDEKSAKILRPV